jgi:hypothetical protein
MKRVSYMLIMALLIQSCKLGVLVVEDNPPDGSLPKWDTSTTFFEEKDGWVRFKTAEPAYVSATGRNFWTLNFQSSSDTISVAMQKQSGMSKYGYGVAFEIEDNKNFMVILIDTNKNYTVGSVEDGRFSYLDDDTWLQSNDLTAGSGVINKVKIQRVDDEKFSLYLNDNLVDKTFTYATSSPDPTQLGLVVTIGEEENFPRIPVEVLFKVL